MIETDSALLDWLESAATNYGDGWICRMSTTGRGMRLHETSHAESPEDGALIADTPREAIRLAMRYAERHEGKL